MPTEKILKIRVVADTGSTEQGFRKLTVASAAAGVAITSYKTQLNSATNETEHFINVTGSNITKLNSLRQELDRVFSSQNKGIDANLIQANPLKDQQKRQLELSRAYANESRIALSALSERLTLEQSIRVNGANAVKTIAIKSAQEEKAIKTNLANTLRQIEEDIKNGSITRMRDAEQSRVRAVKDASREITRIRKALEAEENKVTRRNNSADVYKQETAKITSELDRRLALEHSIRVNGADHIRTIELKAAQDEVLIRERMAAKLLDIERRLRAGTIANRGAANLQRTGVLRQGATDINAIRDTLHAAQVQAEHNRRIEEASRVHKNLFVHVGELVGIYRIWSVTINTVVAALKSIPKIGIELESTQASLTATTGSTAGLASVMGFLDKEAERTGIAIGTLRETFRGFQASTSLAGESLQTTVNIFKDINTVVTSLHLPADKASGIFNALAQIFNKSKVQSEELVKQLGNLIPGAFAAFAAANKAQFANSSVLIEEMKKGTVFAHETVERFAAFLAKRFATSFDIASKGLNANIGRMQTGFTHLGEAIYGLSSGALSAITKNLASFANYLTASIDGTTNLTIAVKVLSQALLVLGGSALLRVVDNALLASSTIAATTGAMSRLSGVGYLAIAALDKLKLAFAFLVNPYTIITGIGLIIYHFGNLQEKANDAARDVAEGSRKMIETLRQLKEKPREEVVLDLKFDVKDDENVKAVRKQIEKEKETIEELSKNQVGLFNFSNVGAMNAALERTKLLKEAKARLEQLNEVEKEAVKIAKDKLQIQNSEQRTLINLTGVNPDSTLKEQQLKELSFTDPVAYARENYLHVASSDIKGLAAKIEQYPKDIKILQEEIARLTEITGSATGAQLDEANLALETQKSRLAEAEDLLTKSISSINLIYGNAEKAGERAQAKASKTDKTAENATKDRIAILKTYLNELKAVTETELRVEKAKIEELQYLQQAGKVSLKDYYSGLIDEAKAEVEIKSKSLVASIDAIKTQMAQLGGAKGDDQRKQELQRLLVNTEQDLIQAKIAGAIELRQIDEDQITRLQRVSDKTEDVVAKYQKMLAELQGLKGVIDSTGSPVVSDSEFAKIEADLQTKITDAKLKPPQGLVDYNNLIKSINLNTKDLAVTNSTVFDAAIGGFNAMAGALDNLTEHLDFYTQQQIELSDKFAKAKQANEKEQDPVLKYSRQKDLEEDYQKTVLKLESQTIKTKLAGTSQIIGAAESMFKKESSMAKALHTINIGLTAARLALDAKEIASSIYKTGIKLAEGASSMFAQGGFFGFAGVAAMIAVMAGLGFNAFGGSAKGANIPTDSGTTGTVLGDSGASSQSVNNVAELLEDIHAKEYRELVGINQSVATMAAGIQDAVASIFRNNELDVKGTFGKTISSIGTAINRIADPLDFGHSIPFLGKITDSITGFLFGSKKVELKAVGIMTSATKLIDVATQGVNSLQYQIDHITKKGAFGGLFGGNKSYDVQTTSPLDKETSTIIDKIFTNASEAIISASKVFNNVFDAAINEFIFPALKVDLKDLKGEDAATKLQEAISTMLDKAANSIFDSLKQYQKLGEGMFETVNRIVIDLAVVRDSLDKVRVPLKEFGLDAIAVAEAIVTASGDVQTAIKNFDAFFEGFFSDVEQQAYNMNNLSGTLQDMGLILPETRDGWKFLTQAMLAGGEATAQTSARLLELSASADDYYKAIEKGQQAEKGITQAGVAAVSKLSEGLDYVYLKFSRLYSLMSVDPTRNWVGFDNTMREAGLEADEALQAALATLEKSSDSVQKAILDKSIVISDLITTIKISAYETLATARLSGDLNSKGWNKQFAAQRKLEAVRSNVLKMEEELYLKQKERIEAEYFRNVVGETSQEKYNRQVQAIEKYQSLIQTKYNKELQILTQTVTAISGIQTHVRELLLNDSLSPESNTQMLERAKQQYQLTLEAAKGGDTTALNNVSSALDTYLTKAREYYASSEEYARIFQQATNEALTLDDLMLTTEQKIESNTARMVEELQRLQAGLGEVDAGRTAVLEADRRAVFDHFNKIASSFLQGIQILVDKVVPGNGVDIGASYGKPKTGTGSQTETVKQYTVPLDITAFDNLMRKQDFTAAASYAIGRGYSKTDIADYVASTYNIQQEETLKWLSENGFANGGSFTNGVVSKPALFNMGVMGEKGSEGILPLTNIGGKLGVHAVVGSDRELIDEIRALRQEVKSLRADQKEHARMTAMVIYDSNDKNAQTIVKGTESSTDKLIWKEKSKPALV